MSMMDLLGQMGQQGAAPQGPPMGGPPQQPMEQEEGPADHSELIRDVLDAARAAAQTADDEQEALTWEKITTLIQQILAQQEKQDQELMQGKVNPSALRRALG